MRLTEVLPATALALLLTATGLRARQDAAPPKLERFEFREPHMGTEFSLVVYGDDPARASAAATAAFARIAELNARLSDYDPDSELMRLCSQAGAPPVPVSDDLFACLDRALQMAERSGGAFDPTIGPVGRLWRRARRSKELPDPAKLAEAQLLVGYQKVHLDPDAKTIRLDTPGMKLDLGGIAKGYAADAALTVLRDHGFPRSLVAAAGDVAAGDPPPGKDAWTVEVKALRASSGKNGPSPFLALSHRAVSTSGDAEQFVEIDGVRYSHILDPRTGVGLRGRSSVTIVAPDGTTADSLATAVSVLGPEKGLPLVEATEGAAAFFVREAPDGSLQVVTSQRWADIPRPGGH